jgi:hypothetical protein
MSISRSNRDLWPEFCVQFTQEKIDKKQDRMSVVLRQRQGVSDIVYGGHDRGKNIPKFQ